MARRYTKKSEYWNRFKKPERHKANLEEIVEDFVQDSPEPTTAGENYYTQSSSFSTTSTAAYSRTGSSLSQSDTTRSRFNKASRTRKMAPYDNIAEGILPYDLRTNYITIRDTILLCQKAYCNIPIFRNAVDVMAEFSNSQIHLEGSTETSKRFIRRWFERINLWKIKDQYFREYYRSGNVFFYRLDGKFSSDDFNKLTKVYGASRKIAKEIPVRFILLNPWDFIITRSTSFDRGIYKKILSLYDLERLQNPKTDEDQMVFDSLEPGIQERISNGEWPPEGLSIVLDPEKLCYSFYKKQDYEPFAIPFGWPVLDDLNWKMELKKIDQAISRTIENVILLVTMGAPPDKGGINPHNMSAMQNLFRNESVGRVLVADYTSKAEFIIPDIGKVIGPEKYEIVNQDIKEGLQNIIVGKENYSSTQIKAQIFLERLKESREAFLKDFLQPQITRICKKMGFKSYPEAKFEEVDIKDEAQLQRVITRLLELGVLSPEQGVHALKSGIYPPTDELLPAQEDYSDQRGDGLWNPLVGGVPPVETPGAPLERNLKKKIAQEKVFDRTKGPIPKGPAPRPGKSTAPGRPPGTSAPQEAAAHMEENFSVLAIQGTVSAIQDLEAFAAKALRKKYDKRKLTKAQNEIAANLVKNVVTSAEVEKWEQSITSKIEDPQTLIQCTELEGVLSLADKHRLDIYSAAILYHSKEQKT